MTKKYYQEHRKELNKKNRDYYIKNKVAIKKLIKEWRKRNPLKAKQYRDQSGWDKNSDKKKISERRRKSAYIRCKRWREKNKEKIKENSIKNREKNNKTSIEYYWKNKERLNERRRELYKEKIHKRIPILESDKEIPKTKHINTDPLF